MKPNTLQVIYTVLFLVQSSAIKYHIKATIDAGLHAAKLNASIGCKNLFGQYWMQHNSLHPMCLKFLLLL